MESFPIIVNGFSRFLATTSVLKNMASYRDDPAVNYMFKVNYRNARTRREICSKLIIKTADRRQWCRYGVFLVNSEHLSHLALVFLSLTL